MRWFVLTFVFCAAGLAAPPQPFPPSTGTNQPPRAARTVHLVYDAAQADMYYIEMRVGQSTDNSSFMPCAWENGFFGLQQFNGETKRALNFSVWNPPELTAPDAKYDDPVEVLYSDPRSTIKHLSGPGGGVQCMRQQTWLLGQTNRFAIQCQTQSNKTAYTAWFFDEPTAKWERLATFRSKGGERWLRGYYSYIEDFRRDFASASETRRAHFSRVWIHQNQGTWVPIVQAMFTVSTLKSEAIDALDAGQEEGAFMLATGGNVKKRQKIGGKILLPEVPLKKPEMPDLWFLYDKPAL